MEEKIKETLKESYCKTEWAKKLGFNYFNGKICKILDGYISKYNLDTSHFKLGKSKEKYQLITKECPVCQSEFETQLNHSREKTVCSRSCSNIYFAKIRHTPEANLKCANSLLKHHDNSTNKRINGYPLVCHYCQESFFHQNKNVKYCSQSCRLNSRPEATKETREKLRQAQLKRIESGIHSGWISRDKCNQSYAEKYVEGLLNKNNIYRGIHYEFEYKQDKYFIDFAFLKEKIAIEIDGKQHELPERQAKDKEKDKVLKSLGWEVFRIKWTYANKKTRQRILSELNKILNHKIIDDTLENEIKNDNK